MAEAAISVVLFKLGQIAASEIRLQLQLGTDITLLRDRLEWLQIFIHEADRKGRDGTANELTRVWVRQTRDVAFEAEDALDDFFHKVVGQKYQGRHRRLKALRSYFTGLFTKPVVRHELAGRIKMIKSRLDQISENKKEYELVYTPSVGFASSTTTIAEWRDNLENAEIFDPDVRILKQMLARKDDRGLFFFMRNGPQHPMFISIVGERGAGKNTLAKIIYREMRSEMKMVVMCNMEPGYSTTDFIEKVYERASILCYEYELGVIDDQHNWDISDKLRQILEGKRYLLILGGISSKTMLNRLRASLPDPNDENNSGGCVMLILDTENEEVAWHANTLNIHGVNGVHRLTHLDRKRSGQLFLWMVQRKSQDGINRLSSQEEDGRYEELVHHITGGHPMAIVLLAGLLRFKQKPIQWEAVLQQLKSVYPPTIDEYAGYRGSSQETNYMYNIRAIQIIFWASFEDLSNDAKSCFLYFSAYHNDTWLYADELVRMWIGEGFIKPQNIKTMVQVGHDYLKELVFRCLVEVKERKDGGGCWNVMGYNMGSHV